MTPYYQNQDVTLYVGDCIDVLRGLPNNSVQCCVTSPPYWGLRDYQTGTWEGGDPSCNHSCGGQVQDSKAPGAIASGVRPGCNASVCRHCGATRKDQQIGLEDTPEAYTARMVEVFSEVRRVLRDDGTLWLNLGDSYSGSGGAGGDYGPGGIKEGQPKYPGRHLKALKPKDLVGIPWRVAFALQADGWYLRQDIIWHKPNPMPESVQDRCTKAHEYVFLLSKSARYFYDAEAVLEKCSSNNYTSRGETDKTRIQCTPGDNREYTGGGRAGGRADGQRNVRSVWTITTKPYSGAHFATFPPELPERCIKAGCPEGGTVLDPFFGAGTTGQVAAWLRRKCIGIELNPEYAELCRKRLAQGVLL